MNYAELFAGYETQLLAVGEEPEALKFVFREMRQLNLTDFVLSLRDTVTDEDAALIAHIFQQLEAHRSAQYILGWAEFSGMQLKVDESVLIPRPETEELVALVLSENSGSLRVLDLCTGSGAIALALKKAQAAWTLVASDISPAALTVARENALGQALAIDFVQSDLFQAISGSFDLIVSNPPYIAETDKDEVGMNVLTSEPHLALFADENGLAIYRQIAEQAHQFLTPQGKIYLEIGHQQGEAVKALFEKHFPEARIRVLKDLLDKDRMVVIDHG